MSLWRRVLLTATAVVLIAVVVGVAVAAAVERSDDAIGDTSMRWGPATVRAQALLTHLVDQETGQRGYVITGDTRYLAPYRRGMDAAERDVQQLRVLIGDDATVLGTLDHVVDALAAWRAQAAEPEIAARRHGVASASRLVDQGTGRRLFDTLRHDVEVLQQHIEMRREAAQQRVTSSNHSLTRWLWATAGVAVVVGLAWVAVLALWVLRPLRQLSGDLRRVSAGELAATVHADGPPEFVQLGQDADAMRRRILDELARSETARQALEQRGPVVLGLSEELAPRATGPIAGLRYAVALRPAEGLLAGDWVDVLPLDAHRVALTLLDVSGHGAAAGLEAMRLKHVITTSLGFGHQPHEAMARAAAGFTEDERFATAVIVVLDVTSGELRWANAGHLSPRLVPMNAATVTQVDLDQLEPTGPLLSSLTSGWTTRTGRLEIGQLVLAFSDGLTEARDSEGRQFGITGLSKALSATTVRDVDTVVSVCLAAVRAHASDPHRDDITVLAAARDATTLPTRDRLASAGDGLTG
ncbi:MAG TPA: SpoIIE family protein phosphatase [Mycobacteriales bacterium]|nr:SpoIIE family protein phosphatase [Mycobacteriales bacterium]